MKNKFSCIWGFIVSINSRNGLFMSKNDGDKKIGADGGHFSEVVSLLEEILTFWLYLKIKPAAMNIFRDITKCLTCNGLFYLQFNPLCTNRLNLYDDL